MTTKSIDVGGVFLMDLNEELAAASVAPQGQASYRDEPTTKQHNLYHQQPHKHHHHNYHHHHQDKSIRLSPTYQFGNGIENGRPAPPGTRAPPQTTRNEHQADDDDELGGPRETGPASVINCDGRQEQQQQQQSRRPVYQEDAEEEAPLSSLSDESYVPSSGTSLSASLSEGLSASISSGGDDAQLTGRQLADEDYELADRESTTTREDSGVLDMKDLEGGQWRAHSGKQHHQQQQQRVPQSLEPASAAAAAVAAVDGQQQQEKSISANIMATNLINKTANGMNNNSNNNNTNFQQNYQHQQHHAANNARRAVSASLPIQVPARQMKKNLNRMKLKLHLMKQQEQQQQQQQQQEEEELQQQQVVAAAAIERQLRDSEAPLQLTLASSPIGMRRGDRNRPALPENMAAFCAATATDDDAAFLNQEFNANHHNHYPIDELDREHLTAEDDPMRLFASIQALAKSLHEDAELFGSLPPKRMLESPIRSLALV